MVQGFPPVMNRHRPLLGRLPQREKQQLRRDFFGSVDHEKLLTLVAQRVADGRVLRLIQAMLQAGSYGKGQLFPTERGTPQGGVVSPTLSNILLTPFDREMRLRGYQLTRYADDWVITCKSAAEARAAVEAARRILKQLGVELHPQKTPALADKILEDAQASIFAHLPQASDRDPHHRAKGKPKRVNRHLRKRTS
jgi:retron-type reverse transcriptase